MRNTAQHGTGDDNCHYQNCEALVNELVAQDKYFELLSYPNRTHALEDAKGPNTRKHLFESLTRHFVRHLAPPALGLPPCDPTVAAAESEPEGGKRVGGVWRPIR